MKRYLSENLFGIKGLNIAWYGIIIAFGMFLDGAPAIYRFKKTNVNREHIYSFALIALPICVISARIYYVVFEWKLFFTFLLCLGINVVRFSLYIRIGRRVSFFVELVVYHRHTTCTGFSAFGLVWLEIGWYLFLLVSQPANFRFLCR